MAKCNSVVCNTGSVELLVGNLEHDGRSAFGFPILLVGMWVVRVDAVLLVVHFRVKVLLK